ncbi:MAG: signal peptidase I [Bacteroidetes bacterium]|nr:signal peptidase I [Bacteroidota bacterium]
MQLLKVTTPASEPTLRQGRIYLSTPLKKPRRFDHISYRAVLPATGLTLMTHRLCGMPGDFVQIKAGHLYVNNEDADSRLRLKHIYKVSTQDIPALTYDKTQSYTVTPYPDHVYVSLEDRYVEKIRLTCQRHILPPGLRDEAVFRIYKKNWNRDNFGPIRVPSGRYFTLGDNRGQSTDSLTLGFIEQNKFVGTVLWK